MVGFVGAIAVLLIVAGTVGVIVPFFPGALVALGGIYFYWFASGFAAPGVFLLVFFTLIAVVSVAIEYFAGAIASGTSGASREAVIAATAAGLVFLLFAGPLGLIFGVAGGAFVAEFQETKSAEESIDVALKSAVGLLTAVGIQLVLIGLMLVLFVVFVL